MLILRFVCILFERWITSVAMRPKNCRPVIIVVFQWLQHDADVIKSSMYFLHPFSFVIILFQDFFCWIINFLLFKRTYRQFCAPPLFTCAHYLEVVKVNKMMVDWQHSAYDGTMYHFKASFLFRNGYKDPFSLQSHNDTRRMFFSKHGICRVDPLSSSWPNHS